MTKLNFKTKKVTLPLDINKTYVLVDADGYVKANKYNQEFVDDFNITEPFKLEDVDEILGGYLNNRNVILLPIDISFFREVIYPESGDAVIMTKTNSTGRYIAYDDKQHMHVINIDGVLVYAEDYEFELKQEQPSSSWQEQLCEEFDIEYNKDEDSFKFLRDYSTEGAIKLAKRILEVSGE